MGGANLWNLTVWESWARSDRSHFSGRKAHGVSCPQGWPCSVSWHGAAQREHPSAHRTPGMEEDGQLLGRKHYSPKQLLGKAAQMTKPRNSMTFHSALTSLNITDILLFFLLKQPHKSPATVYGEGDAS